jgi:alpha-galactosidase
MIFNGNFKVLEPASDVVRVEQGEGSIHIILTPSITAVKQVKIKWFFDTSFMKKVLPDSWGVALANLGWKTLPLERPAEWYFAAFDGEHTHGFGVKTGCNSFCSWTIESDGVTLICDTRNGGEGVELTAPLLCAEAVYYKSRDGETPYEACHSFCRMMCEKPKLPGRPIYGFNTWYYTYGDITRSSVMEDARLCARLASATVEGAPRPIMVIDDGWNKNGKRVPEYYNGGPFVANDDFGNMTAVAEDISALGCDPGIWVRPMLVLDDLCPHIPKECYSENQEFPKMGKVLDPTTEGTREYVATLIGDLAQSGYRLIKHDFTCPDLMGKQFLDPTLTCGGWHWHDRTKTNAQVFKELYTLIQTAANGAHIIGCNIYNHLAAGIHDIVRSGCDTSGEHWHITRDYGVNTLAFRLCQNNAFFMADADCAAFTEHVPTELNMRFAELISMSDSALFISAAPGILTGRDEERLMLMFRRASQHTSGLAPVDWMERMIPEQYICDGEVRRYEWNE